MKGIYKIQNIVTLQIYVGLSNDIIRRKKEHLTSLLGNRHENKHLQHSFNKYGKDNFQFTIIDSNNNYSIKDLELLEKLYIMKYNSFNKTEGFNKTLGGERGCLGYNHTEYNLNRISENNYQNKKVKIFVLLLNIVLNLNFCTPKPCLRKAPKRYAQCYDTQTSDLSEAIKALSLCFLKCSFVICSDFIKLTILSVASLNSFSVPSRYLPKIPLTSSVIFFF